MVLVQVTSRHRFCMLLRAFRRLSRIRAFLAATDSFCLLISAHEVLNVEFKATLLADYNNGTFRLSWLQSGITHYKLLQLTIFIIIYRYLQFKDSRICLGWLVGMRNRNQGTRIFLWQIGWLALKEFCYQNNNESWTRNERCKLMFLKTQLFGTYTI